MMNRLGWSLSKILRRCRSPAAPRRLLHWCASAPSATPAVAVLGRRPPSTVPPRPLRWYHDPRKAAAATAIGLSAAAMAALEVVPCTNRSHVVVLSIKKEHNIAESHFAELKHTYRHRMVDPRDPDSIRVRLIAERIVHAANRGLGIYDSRDAPLLRVTRKGKKKPWAPHPQTRHLHDLHDHGWELHLAIDRLPNIQSSPGGRILVFTGLLDWFKTDGEIAFCLAHEIGHLIARHQADITSRLWLPEFLHRLFGHRNEMEADRIGILLLAAAGFHPQYALTSVERAATIVGDYSVLKETLKATHPHPKRRLRHLSEAMEEALELYNEATAMDKVTGKYFSGELRM